jgi:RNA polymerase sigma-70 factor, ECF subfamily
LALEHADLEPTDSELVAAAQRGDERAFRMIVDRHAKRLYGLDRSLVGSDADAEDVVQETLIGAYKQLPKFEGRSSLKTWLSRICVLQVSKVYRSRGVRKMGSLDAGGEEPSILSKAQHSDRQADIETMLKTLSPEHREVLMLRELQGLSYKEIADALGVPQGTVESRLFRARQQLKESFEGYLQ